MHYLTLALSLLLLTLVCPHRVVALSYTGQESVVIVKKTVVLIRTGRVVKEQPHRKRATVSYPIVKSGVSDPVVLGRVRSLLNVKNIFDSSLEEYRQDTWLSEFDYTVNYNKNFILDITFSQEGSGAYPDTHHKHLAINLKTGRVIKVTDVFKHDTLEKLAEMIDKRLQADLKETVDQVDQYESIDAEEKASVPELYRDLRFQVKDLNEFIINDEGITFLYDAGFPHVVQAYEPAEQYKFSYAELVTYLVTKRCPTQLD